jgi:hypothetical protein
MLSFLVSHYKKHKTALLTISGASGSAIGFLWGFDLQKLTPSGTLPSETLWEIRIVMTPVLISLYFLSLLVLTLYHYKKDSERLIKSTQELEKIQADFDTFKKSASDFKIAQSIVLTGVGKKLVEEFSKPDPPQRSFPGPKIPIAPASASSEPGPDDYHAKRKSFFNSDKDRPKRK